MIKINPKNSALNINNIAAALQNVKIKNKTDSIGLVEKETKNPHNSIIKHKNLCKKSIKFDLLIKTLDFNSFRMMWFEHMTFYSQNRHATKLRYILSYHITKTGFEPATYGLWFQHSTNWVISFT